MRFTLWAEGPSDACLIPILTWLLRQCGVYDDIETDEEIIFRSKDQSEFATITKVFEKEDYWSDLLFVHMDADNDKETSGKGPTERDRQCQDKVNAAGSVPPYICVIPVRETETWLLGSEKALRQATGNPKTQLTFPGRSHLEGINSKQRLCDILRELGIEIGNDADAELWKAIVRNIRLAEPQSYGILRGIPSFDNLEKAVKKVVDSQRLAYR